LITGAFGKRGIGKRRNTIAGVVFSTLVTLLIVGAVSFNATPAAARYASLVVDGDSGMELYSRNADTERYPASLTKIMTLYMTFDALQSGKWTLETRLKVSQRASRQPQTRLGLKPGQTITVHQAILALITRSANDVATVIGENLAGTELRFAEKMTRRAKALGMIRTTFRNASGLPNKGQVSTARDMVTLAQAIRRDFPRYYPLFRTQEFRFNGRVFKNHNTLLGRYNGTEGIKTGYTNASGYNLVASVNRDGKKLIGVVFGGKTSTQRDRHMIRLLDRGFAKMTAIAQLPTPPLPLPKPSEETVQVAGAETPTGVARDQAAGEHADTLAFGGQYSSAEPRAAKQGRITDKAKSSDFEPRQPEAVLPPHWGIQVGAYSSDGPARAIIVTARDHLGPSLGHGRERVERVHRRHGTIYRARIMGLREAEARDACAVLVTKHLPCVPVPGDVTVASAAEEN
jgi:D-alanyl-D-alanine carboxypeptidase